MVTKKKVAKKKATKKQYVTQVMNKTLLETLLDGQELPKPKNGFCWPKRSQLPSLTNFPIVPLRFDKLPKKCLKCTGELDHPNCNARLYMFPEWRDPLKFVQKCGPMGGDGGD